MTVPNERDANTTAIHHHRRHGAGNGPVVRPTACGSSSKDKAATPTTTAATTAARVPPGSRGRQRRQHPELLVQPGNDAVKVGTKVTWTNQDSFNHTVKTLKGPAKSDSSPIQPGKSFSYVFTKPGTYPYICGIHTTCTGLSSSA